MFYENYERKLFWILKDCAISVIDHLENEDMNTEIEKIREAKKPMTAAERQAKAKVNLDEDGKRLIEEFDKELEQDEEITEKQKAKAKWTKLEAIVGNKERIKRIDEIKQRYR